MHRLIAVTLLLPLVGVRARAERARLDHPRTAVPAELAGAWWGTVAHDGETTPIGLEIEPGDDDKALLKLSSPIIHVRHAPLGRGALRVEGDSVKVGPFAFTYDRAARTL